MSETETTPEQEQRLQAAIDKLLRGETPNGETSQDYGPYNEMYQVVYQSYNEGGAEQARTTLAAILRAEPHMLKRFPDWLTVVATTRPAPATTNGLSAQNNARQRKPRWTIMHADNVMDMPPPEWMIPDILPYDDLVCIYGASNVGKSFITLDIALTVAQQYPVVYVAAEALATYTVRMQAWCKFRKSVSGNLYFCTDAINLTDISEVNVFIEAIKSLNPVLVVYDTLARCSTGMAENDTGDMGVFVEHADLVRRATGATQLFVHHSGKSGQEERGSSALRAACCMMQRVIYDDGIIRLSCDKSRISAGFDDRKFRLVAVPDTDGVIPLPAAMVKDDGKLTDLQQATVEYLARDINADIFISQTDIADAIGKGKGSVNKMLNKLIRMQLAEKNGSGKVRITTAGLRVAQELEQDEAPEASQTIDTSGYNWQVSRREND